MTMTVGVFSGADPRPWVLKQYGDQDARTVAAFADRIEAAGTYQVLYPGRARAGWDRLCHSMPLADAYAREFAEAGVAALVNVHPTWTFPQTSQRVVEGYRRIVRSKDGTFEPRLLLASIQDPTVPGMVSGMATGGAFNQNGEGFVHVYGDFEDDATWKRIFAALRFFEKRAAASEKVRDLVNGLHRLHAIEFGSFSLQMPTTRINQEELARRWGITSESLDQQVFLDRAFRYVEWAGAPGKSAIRKIRHEGVLRAVENVYDRHPEKFQAIPDRSVPRDKYALQVAMYFATQEIAEEKGAGAVTIKCQDECSAHFATCCMATSFLGNDVDMNGTRKRVVPTSCETDLPTMYTQVLLKELSGKPSGFGDFRYVKTDGGSTKLAIVNCGQHPQYYAGRETDDLATKQANTEHPGQEHFYAAGGAAVRMRTAGGQTVTVARLGVENGRLYLAATVMKTLDVPRERHDAYNKSWPIIEGLVPVSDTVLGRRWPSNHLAFVYGDYVAELVELADRMGLGYLIWDARGDEYYRPS